MADNLTNLPIESGDGIDLTLETKSDDSKVLKISVDPTDLVGNNNPLLIAYGTEEPSSQTLPGSCKIYIKYSET